MFTLSQHGFDICVETLVESSTDSNDIDQYGTPLEVHSEYLISIMLPEKGLHWDIILRLEGNPGPATAIHQCFKHIMLNFGHPLEMVARCDIDDKQFMIYRLKEVLDCMVMGMCFEPSRINRLLDDLPPWDLSCGRYAVLSVENKCE
jgi:hypothetical protein